MSIQNILLEIVSFRNAVGSRSPESKEYSEQLHRFTKLAFAQKRKRDQHAILELVNAIAHDISVHELSLAYMVNGTLHCVHKDHVPNCLSTERLHRSGFSSAEWDSFPKYHVWVKTGKVLAPVA